MGITRRSLLQLMAGTSAGVMVSPIPWKLLDDVSIWTQTWFLTAKLPRGETKDHFVPCGQCSGGCGIRVRTLGDEPISVTGQDQHPTSLGGVCALAMASPELRFHPLRIAKPVMKNGKGEFVSANPKAVLEKIGRELSACKADPSAGGVGVLDWRPGGAGSALYRELLKGVGGGHQIIPPTAQSALDSAMARIFPTTRRVGYDFARTKTVLSLGAPLFEGFGCLGRMIPMGRRWRETRRENRPGLYHADSNGSVSSSMADKWLPIKPGTETALALGVGHVLLKQNLVRDAENRVQDLGAYVELVEAYSPDEAAKITGLDAASIIDVARNFASNGPALALAGNDSGAGPKGEEEEVAAMGLNILAGNFGAPGGVLELPPWPPEPEANGNEPGTEEGADFSKSLAEVEDGSIRLLLIDGHAPDAALPWRMIQTKLSKNALTVSLNPFLTGTNLNADIVLPSAVTHEWEFDVPTPPLAPRGSFGISKKLCNPPPGITTPAKLVQLMAKAGDIPMRPDAYKKHVTAQMESIVSSGRGTVFDPKTGKSKAVSSIAKADHLYKALVKGGTWTDDGDPPARDETARITRGLEHPKTSRIETLKGSEDEFPFLLMPFGNHGESGGNAMPRMMTKLYRESNLRQLHSAVHINPVSAETSGLGDGAAAEMITPTGSLKVHITHDKTVMPGVLKMAVAPSPLDLGDVKDGAFKSLLEVVDLAKGGVWRLTRASLREVKHV